MTDKEKIKEEIERRIEQWYRILSQDLLEIERKETSCCLQQYKEILKFIDSLPEEPVSRDLEEEIDRFEDWLNNFNQSDYPTSYTVRDIARHFANWQFNQMKEILRTEYEKGRFDMREEMMKTLVEGEIVKDIHNQLKVTSEPLNDTFRKFGNKVKIIIVKED